MLLVTISCARSETSQCPQLLVRADTAGALADAVTAQFAVAKWTVKDGEHFCPTHDPAEAGELLEITPVRYRPIGDSGWEARVPGHAYAQGMGVNIEIRPCSHAAAGDEGPDEAEPVSATDSDAAAVDAFLNALDAHLNDFPRSVQDAGFIASPEWADVDLRAPWLRALLAERAAVRALAPDSRELDDPFYRPGGVYVSANGWWRFTCKAVVAGVALGVEECPKDRMEPRFTKRNVWRAVRTAGCDTQVDPATGEPLDGLDADDD